FKVGIGTLASVALYEDLLGRDLSRLDVDRIVDRWPPGDVYVSRAAAALGDLAALAADELRAKYPSADELRAQLTRLRDGWPDLRPRLGRQLIPFGELRDMLRDAGCPCEPEQIGIS